MASAMVHTDDVFAEQSTFGHRASDKVAAIAGSWPFILIQPGVFLIWVVLNVTALVRHWDPYPFILMNLVLSLQVAFTAPIIMMSQNRQAEKDRIDAHNDFIVFPTDPDKIEEHILGMDQERLDIRHDSNWERSSSALRKWRSSTSSRSMLKRRHRLNKGS